MSDRPPQGAPPAGPDEPELLQGPGSGGTISAEAQPGASAIAGGDLPLTQATLWGDAWRRLRRNPLFLMSAFVIVLFTIMAIVPGAFVKTASAISSQENADPTPDPDPQVECDILKTAQSPGSEHLFGYDVQGCDYFTRVIYGARVSMLVGLMSVGFAVLIAVILGCISGFYGGLIDAFIARTADIVFAIPTILGGIVLLAALGNRGLLQVSLVLVILGWPTIMRLMRSTVLSVKEADYVQAARSLGASDFRILRTHIVPNAIAPVLVYATISVGIIIAAEAALSFLGVGLQLPAISWGLQIAQAEPRILLQSHLLMFPSIFLIVLVLSFILLGDALRDALDPKLQR